MSPISSSSSVPPSAAWNSPLWLATASVNGALDVAEQLGLEQGLGDGAAVHRDEGLAGARAGLVDGLGQQFLAGAAFAAQQHAGVGLRHHARFGQCLGHAAGAADDLVLPGFGAAAPGRAGGRAQGQGLGDLVEQALAVKRLGEVGEHAALGGFHRVGNGAVGGQQDHRQGRCCFLMSSNRRQAVPAGQAHVAEHQLRPLDVKLRRAASAEVTAVTR